MHEPKPTAIKKSIKPNAAIFAGLRSSILFPFRQMHGIAGRGASANFVTGPESEKGAALMTAARQTASSCKTDHPGVFHQGPSGREAIAAA